MTDQGTLRRSANLGCVLALLLMSAACADRVAPSGKSATTSAEPSRLVVTRNGMTWFRSSNNLIHVASRGKEITFTPPGKLGLGDGGIAVDGRFVFLAAANGRELTLASSVDQGSSWRTTELRLPYQEGPFSVVTNPRSKYVVAASSNGGSRPSSVGYVRRGGQTMRVSIPGAATNLGESSTTLFAPGGPDNTRLFKSADGGVSWDDATIAVLGIEAPAANVAPTVPVFQPVLSMPDGTVDIPVTRTSDGVTTVTVFSTTNGSSFAHLGSAGPFDTGTEGGLSLVESSDEASGVAFVEPGRDYLVKIGSDGQTTAIAMGGIQGTPTAISFETSNSATLETSSIDCDADKSNCVTAIREYYSSDGGQTWTPT